MRKDEIIMIEKELNIRLTESYKRVVENNPLCDKNRYPYVSDSLLDDAEEIIKLNLNLRENGLQNKPWSEKLFVIGTKGTSCYYFIVLNEKEDGNIYSISVEDKYNPKNIKKELFKKTFESFIDHMQFMQNLLNRHKNE